MGHELTRLVVRNSPQGHRLVGSNLSCTFTAGLLPGLPRFTDCKCACEVVESTCTFVSNY